MALKVWSSVASLALLTTMLTLGTAAAVSVPPHLRRVRRDQQYTNMVFYMHDIATAPQPTAVLVAAQNGNFTSPSKLGMTLVFDDKLTAGPNPDSTELGRGQGIYTFASLTSPDLFLIFTAVLHKPAHYEGSTICLHGSDRIALPEREIGVVGGTGVFRFARGYAILSTVSVDGLNAVIKLNITMLL